MSHEEEDTCMSYEEEDTCLSDVGRRVYVTRGGGYMHVI